MPQGTLRLLCGQPLHQEIADGESSSETVAVAIVVSTETGAIVGEVYEGDKLRLVRQNSISSYRDISHVGEGEALRVNRGRRFAKVFSDNIDRLCEVLSPNDLYLLFRLIPYSGVNNGVLRHRNGAGVTRSQIVDMCKGKLSRSSVDRSLSALSKAGILASEKIEKRKAYILNPFVVQNGNLADKGLLRLFGKTEWVDHKKG